MQDSAHEHVKQHQRATAVVSVCPSILMDYNKTCPQSFSQTNSLSTSQGELF